MIETLLLRIPFVRSMAAELGRVEEQLESARKELESERGLRLREESRSEERWAAWQKAEERADRLENAMATLQADRIKSVDLVNTTLLKALAPEASTTPSNVQPILKDRVQSVTQGRRAEREFLGGLIASQIAKERPKSAVSAVPMQETQTDQNMSPKVVN